MPAQLASTADERFRCLRLESGYSVRSSITAVFSELLSRPLSAVQRTIGPMSPMRIYQWVAC